MRKITWLIWVFLLIAAFSSVAFGDDELTFIGFSEDGKYLAFEIFSPFSEAGDGNTWKTYIIETARNSFAVPPVVVITDTARPEKPPAAYRIYKQKLVPAVLRKFGIKLGNKGRRVVSHSGNEWSGISPSERKPKFLASDGTISDDDKNSSKKERILSLEKIIFYRSPYLRRQNRSKFYELILKTSPVIESDAVRIELTLQDKTKNRFINSQILQKDGNVLPDSRGPAYEYKIESVYLYKNRIAVFINSFGYGYEETAMSYLVVTGKINQ